jgi:hypothetical protein
MAGSPGQSRQELLIEQFYAWEKRGRGWRVWDYPVEIEPPFRPFFYHFAPRPAIVDDARKPGLIGSMIESVRGRLTSKTLPAEIQILGLNGASDLDEETVPATCTPTSELLELAVSIPPKCSIKKETAQQFVLGLNHAPAPVAFEVIGSSQQINVQLVSTESAGVKQQLCSYFPEVVGHRQDGFLKRCWEEAGPCQGVIVDFGLSNEFTLPLKVCRNFDIDPLIAIVGALSDLKTDETAVFQILFQSVCHPWAESMLRAVTDGEGRSFFDDAPDLVSLAKQKVAQPLFAVVIRVAARSPDQDRSWQIARALGGALNQLANPTINELIPLSNDGYDDFAHESDLLLRHSHRSGMILNCEELISLVHLPSAAVINEKLRREERRTKAAPDLSVGHDLVLGENIHAGKTIQVTLSPEQRTRHTYVIGASGTGKSTFLLNLIVQDIKAGKGLGVLDPHGDLIDQILRYIPEERSADVVLLDPSDEEYPVGFNILCANSELEKNLLSSDLVATFRRLSTSWGDQMNSVLGNAILAFLESPQGGTLADLRRFLVESEFRKEFLATVRDQEVVYYWQREFPLLAGKPQGPILTRLDIFLRPKLIRNMISQKENRFDFRTIMDRKKIFLAKLAQGAIGEENAYLLGTLIVSKLHQIALSRQEVAESQRPDFFLYIDEFHNFVTPSMASILSGARKYHLGLILAHQELRQLWSRDQDVASAVISNAYTRICFRLGDFDAQKLKDGFSIYEAKDLQNLGIGEAIARIERAEYDFNLKTMPLPGLDPAVAQGRRERVIALSREAYARKRVEVEADRIQATVHEESVPLIYPRVSKSDVIRARGRELKERPVSEATPSPMTEKKKPSVEPTPPAGRGGSQHKYLQQLIKRLAEAKGYKAIIEKQILGGAGSVDVSLEKEDQKIACEISVTSTGEQELANVQKCLAAGYDQVILLSTEKKGLNRLKSFIPGQLEKKDLQKVLFLMPEELVSHLEESEAKAAGKEKTVRGYKVKVKYRPMGEEEKKTRRQAISSVILRAVKRMKGKG